jgi:hypothetical protein
MKTPKNTKQLKTLIADEIALHGPFLKPSQIYSKPLKLN